MWTIDEIQDVTKLLSYSSVEDFLTSDEISVIPEAWLPNLRDRVFVPTHTRMVINFNLICPIDYGPYHYS